MDAKIITLDFTLIEDNFKKEFSDDDIKNEIAQNRGRILNENNKIYSLEEFNDKLKEILYGNKKNLKIDNNKINDILERMKTTDILIANAKKIEKK